MATRKLPGSRQVPKPAVPGNDLSNHDPIPKSVLFEGERPEPGSSASSKERAQSVQAAGQTVDPPVFGTRRTLIAILLVQGTLAALLLPRLVVLVAELSSQPLTLLPLPALLLVAAALFIWGWWRRRWAGVIGFCFATAAFWLYAVTHNL